MARDQATIEAFRRIEAEELLTGTQMKVYEALFKNGPCTATELVRLHGIDGGWKRLSELKRRGCIAETGFRTCRVSGSHALTWDVTSSVPTSSAVVEAGRKEQIRILEKKIKHYEKLLTLHKSMLLELFALAGDKAAASAVILKGEIAKSKGL